MENSAELSFHTTGNPRDGNEQEPFSSRHGMFGSSNERQIFCRFRRQMVLPPVYTNKICLYRKAKSLQVTLHH